MTTTEGLPRQAWMSEDQCYRVVIVADGQLRGAVVYRSGANRLPIGQNWALEVIDGYDGMGCKRWRAVEHLAEPGIWFHAFACLAREHGLFGGADTIDQLRAVLAEGGA